MTKLLKRRPIRHMPYERRGEGLTIRNLLDLSRRRRQKQLMRTLLFLEILSALSDDTDDDDGDSSDEDDDGGVLMLAMCAGAGEASYRRLLYKVPEPLAPIGKDKYIHIDCYRDNQFYRRFRFYKADVRKMLLFFDFPEVFVLPDRHTVRSETAFLFMLRRLALWMPYAEYREEFHRAAGELSVIFNFMVRHMATHYGHCVVANFEWYIPRLDSYHAAVQNFLVNSPINPSPPNRLSIDCMGIIGFVDGTSHSVARPTNNRMQNVMFNGYYFTHQLLHQAVTFPDGMVILETAVGYHTDYTHWTACKTYQSMLTLNAQRAAANLPPYCLYGDSIYLTGTTITASYARRRHGVLTQRQIDSNVHRNSARAVVEWSFNQIKNSWKFVQAKGIQRTMQSPVRAVFQVCALMNNLKVILHGTATNLHFNEDTPTFDAYLSQQRPP
jgi:hypothetical protein